ncbi:Serine/threonine-protein phosphatase 4 regulatory subunit 4 [Globomyces sp. JEL0801]|nr:Serine/threonine-protein phosphatase 4 regulatory subunit 4 [Globomyces sp. JEL0801]
MEKTSDEWSWDSMMLDDDISVADELKGRGEIGLSKSQNRELTNNENNRYLLELGSILTELIPKIPVVRVPRILNQAKVLIQHKNEEIVRIWKDVFVTCINRLPVGDSSINQHVMPIIGENVGLAQPPVQRIWCGRVLGVSANKIDPKMIESVIFPRVIKLCQDTDYEVRKSMCLQLGSIINSLGFLKTKKALFCEYMELIKDEEGVVQQAALASLMDISDSLDSETKQVFLIPLWKKLTSDPTPKLIDSITELFGKFFWAARNELSDTDKSLFLSFYQSRVASENTTHKEYCVFYFPAIVNVLKAKNFEQNNLDKILESFVLEDNPVILESIASSLHEVAILLGKLSFRYLKDALLKLLNNPHESVMLKLFQGLNDTLKSFIMDESIKKSGYLDTLFKCIIEKQKRYESTPNINWRSHLKILRSFSIFPNIFEAELVSEHCVPPLFKILYEPYPTPIKYQVIKILVTYLREINRLDHIETILRHLLDIKEDKSYHHRMLFFDICEQVMLIFSQKFFRSYFLNGYLSLSRDTVVNMRLRYISLLPMVRHTIRNTRDSLLLSRLIDATEPLATRDPESDVLNAMSQFYGRYGLLNSPDCCRNKTKSSNNQDFIGLENTKSQLQKNDSIMSLTDECLIKLNDWEIMDADDIDSQKEERENNQSLFQLGLDWNNKKREAEKKDITKKLPSFATPGKKSTITPIAPSSTARKPTLVEKPATPSSQSNTQKSLPKRDGPSGPLPSLPNNITQAKKTNAEELKALEAEIKKVNLSYWLTVEKNGVA